MVFLNSLTATQIWQDPFLGDAGVYAAQTGWHLHSTIPHVSYSLNSLKGYIGDDIWKYYWVKKVDARSLDYRSCRLMRWFFARTIEV